MNIKSRLIALSWVSLLHNIDDCQSHNTAPSPIRVYLKGVMANVLDERERQVVTLRWGLEDGMPQTLAVIGRKLGFSRERIRQIEAKAIRRIRTAKGRRNYKFVDSHEWCRGVRRARR